MEKTANMTKEQAEALMREIGKDLETFAKSHIAEVEPTRVRRTNFGKSVQIVAGSKDNTELARINIKAGDIYRAGKGFTQTVFVSVSGGYLGRSTGDNRTRTYQVRANAGLAGLDKIKARMVQVVNNIVEHEKVAADNEAKRRAGTRKIAKLLKENGWRVVNNSTEAELDAEEDYDWAIYVDLRGQKSGIEIGFQSDGGIRIRLRDGMTLEELLKKIG